MNTKIVTTTYIGKNIKGVLNISRVKENCHEPNLSQTKKNPQTEASKKMSQKLEKVQKGEDQGQKSKSPKFKIWTF